MSKAALIALAVMLLIAVTLGFAIIHRSKGLPQPPEVAVVEQAPVYRVRAFGQASRLSAWVNAQLHDGYIVQHVGRNGPRTLAVVVYAPEQAAALLTRRATRATRASAGAG